MTGTGQISFKGGDNVAEKKPIIKLYILKGKEAWFRLSEEEQKEYGAKLRKKMEELGVKQIISCDCRWSNQEWYGFGVQEFPDIEAVQEYAKFLEELGHWMKYVESKTYLGTRAEE